jgi:hypothetical protein
MRRVIAVDRDIVGRVVPLVEVGRDDQVFRRPRPQARKLSMGSCLRRNDKQDQSAVRSENSSGNSTTSSILRR